MELLVKYLNVIVIASLKFFWAPPYAYLFKLSLTETFILIELGGLLGFILYYKLFRFLVSNVRTFWRVLYYFTPFFSSFRWEERLDSMRYRNLTASKFKQSNRRIVRLRQKFGMAGIIILTPVLLSIPIGALLGSKYFRHKKGFVPWMLFSIFIWGIVSIIVFGWMYQV